MKRDVRDYLAYLESMGRSPATLCAYRQRLRYLQSQIGPISLVSLTAEDLRRYFDGLADQCLKPSTRSAYMGSAAAFLRWAHEQGRILVDLAQAIERPRKAHKLPPAPLTREQIDKLLAIPDDLTAAGKRNRAILELFYGCGLRRSELLGLNVGDVDPREQTVFVEGKGGRQRLVPIHDRALTAVRAYLQSRPGKIGKLAPLFISHDSEKSRRMSSPALTMMFRKVSKKMGIHVHPHLLRHTYACHLVAGGADVRYVQALLGHESVSTTSRYLGLVKQELQDAYDCGIEQILGIE